MSGRLEPPAQQRVVDSDTEVLAASTDRGWQQSPALESNLKNMKVPFPFKLHLLLEEVHTQGLDHIISWVPDGTAFIVHDRTQFEEQIMNQYFRQSRFTSFVRQVSKHSFADCRESAVCFRTVCS